MALGETQVMAATKRALAEDGVDVAKLESAAAAAGAGAAANNSLPRSADTLLVKNLPYSATASELEVSAVFGRQKWDWALTCPGVRDGELVGQHEPRACSEEQQALCPVMSRCWLRLSKFAVTALGRVGLHRLRR